MTGKTFTSEIKCGKCGNADFALRQSVFNGDATVIATCKCGREVGYDIVRVHDFEKELGVAFNSRAIRCWSCGKMVEEQKAFYVYHGDQDDRVCGECAKHMKHTDTAYAGQSVYTCGNDSIRANYEGKTFYGGAGHTKVLNPEYVRDAYGTLAVEKLVEGST